MKRNYFIVSLVMLIAFVISFLTNILGPIIPELITDFNLNLGLAGFLPFSFFIAYGVMSIPSGIIVEQYGEKKTMTLAFVIASIGALLFALVPTFPVAMISLFIIGMGMAMLQVTMFPLLRAAGGEKHFAFNAVLAQLFFGLASFLSPMVYSYLALNVHNAEKAATPIIEFMNRLTPPALPWASLYWIFALIAAVMAVIILVSRFPKVELKEDEKAGTFDIYKTLIRKKVVLLYFLGLFFYVGSEQGIANWMSQFLFTYHGYDPQTEGANAVSLYWGLMTVGAFFGLILLKFMSSKNVLTLFSLSGAIALALALFGPAQVSYYSFSFLGFSLSVMWSIIIALALNSIAEHHGAYTGILVTGIIGGAVVPLIVGWLGEFFGLKIGMMFLFLTLGYIISIGFWARPLVDNETVFNKGNKENETK
ncbi:MAG: sugar MFS transporter [Cyclobacteriaceae bacterium]|nr:sugar MFS transporter [Cyclobacteriaceae bacterium]